MKVFTKPLKADAFDRNLTPDKLDIILQNEAELICSIGKYIEEFYAIQQTRFQTDLNFRVMKQPTMKHFYPTAPVQKRKEITPDCLKSFIIRDSKKPMEISFDTINLSGNNHEYTYITEKRYSIDTQLSLPKEHFYRMKSIIYLTSQLSANLI